MRVSFKLTMPSRGSWNNQWSGQDNNYEVVKNLPKKTIEKLQLNEGSKHFSYRWDDGWRASIEVRIMETGERKKKSDGFFGCNWMINNIVDYGDCSGKEV